MDDTLDTSDFGGVPIELYKVTVGSGEARVELCVTNHEEDVEAMGLTFYSDIISRTDIVIDNDHSAEQRFSLEVDANSRLAMQFVFTSPSDGDTLDVYRCQLDDIENTLLYTWRGVLVGVERDYPMVTISCQSIKSLHNGTGCYTRYGRGRCRHLFMHPVTCKYFETPYLVLMSKLDEVTYQFNNTQELPPKGLAHYLGGVVSFQGQHRTITNVVPGALIVNIDFPFTADPVVAGDYDMRLSPGCDLSFDMCLNKFNNANNYGGYDDMPIGSGPFGGVPMYNANAIPREFQEMLDAMDGLDKPD